MKNLHIGKLTIDSFYIIVMAAMLFLLLILPGKAQDILAGMGMIGIIAAVDTAISYFHGEDE